MNEPLPVPWPATIDAVLLAEYGWPTAVVPLGGMSGARVYRVRFGTTSVITKATTRPEEAEFYERVAGTLRRQGIPVPDLDRVFRAGDELWLILEDVPHPLPRERWEADAEVLAVLARLHAATWGRPYDLPGAFVSAWPDDTTALALSCFGADVAAGLRRLLDPFRRESQQLFRPLCSISGNPNPTNWGMRRDGTLVLYDWEQFGAGTPALDLAVTVPGLGTPAAFAAVARGYCRAWAEHRTTSPWTADRLARDVGVAKVWSVVEFLAAHAGGDGVATRPVLEQVLLAVSDWLKALARSGELARPDGSTRAGKREESQ